MERRRAFWTGTAELRFGPSFEEGSRADQADAALPLYRRGGEVRHHIHHVKSDLPGRVDIKVAWHLLGRHALPSSKEGPKRCPPDSEQSGARHRRCATAINLDSSSHRPPLQWGGSS